MVEAFGVSHPGLVRTTNEDGFICDDELRLFAVADGMGGHSAGEVASSLALEALAGFIRRSHDNSDFSWPYGVESQLSLGGNRLRTAAYLANRRVFRASESRDDYAGMGTTMTAALVVERTLSYAHVGDSRLCRITSEGTVEQVTRDDSWVATVLANEPNVSKADLARHPMRHVLTNVIGARDDVQLQVGELELGRGDVFLLCSDGLHGMVDEAQIGAIAARHATLEVIARGLVDAALAAGGHDNITAVLLRYRG